jgi:GNAT superfamily N-acetyltransferase
MNIIGPELQRQPECEAVLRSLPKWFGIEQSLLQYAADSGTKPTFAIELAGRVTAFISLQEHFPESWEVHCIAVHADFRGKGQGSHLLTRAEDWLRSRGAVFLQIKTIAATKEDPYYAESRAFYLAKGYRPVEVFPTIWHPSNPALQLLKHLGVGASEQPGG